MKGRPSGARLRLSLEPTQGCILRLSLCNSCAPESELTDEHKLLDGYREMDRDWHDAHFDSTATFDKTLHSEMLACAKTYDWKDNDSEFLQQLRLAFPQPMPDPARSNSNSLSAPSISSMILEFPVKVVFIKHDGLLEICQKVPPFSIHTIGTDLPRAVFRFDHREQQHLFQVELQ